MKFAYILIVLGSLLLSVWGVHRYTYRRSLLLSDSLLSYYSKSNTKENRILYIEVPAIPKLSVTEAEKLNGNWTISNIGANHVRQSAYPGEYGNIILYGHNTYKIFGKLPQSKTGDIISITMASGIVHQYIIIKTKEVSPTEVELLKPTTTESLTIYTCSGWFDTKRFVVRAIPLH